ncbi:MAG: hypothetical protein QOH57_780 [Mycobacterium sp.]|nr:hypothetical protein [Mycobacterium sp.]
MRYPDRASVAAVNRDPLAPLAELPGVAEAGARAGEALAKAHRHRTNLRGWQASAAEAAVRAAQASSTLDGGAPRFPADGAASGPVLAGALRVAESLEGGQSVLVGVWRRAPLQALARLHALAAANLVDADALGRPRDDTHVADRLDLLAGLMTGGSNAPAPVLAAVAHGEILTLTPFGSADGVVARAVSRLVTQASGLDPHGLGVPEVYWMRNAAEYRSAAQQFAAGTSDGLRQWLLLCCRGLEAGAREALTIAEGTST